MEPSRHIDAPTAPSAEVAPGGPPPAGDGGAAPARRPTVDEMGEWSFPASDPPATWTWEPRSA